MHLWAENPCKLEDVTYNSDEPYKRVSMGDWDDGFHFEAPPSNPVVITVSPKDIAHIEIVYPNQEKEDLSNPLFYNLNLRDERIDQLKEDINGFLSSSHYYNPLNLYNPGSSERKNFEEIIEAFRDLAFPVNKERVSPVEIDLTFTAEETSHVTVKLPRGMTHENPEKAIEIIEEAQ